MLHQNEQYKLLLFVFVLKIVSSRLINLGVYYSANVFSYWSWFPNQQVIAEHLSAEEAAGLKEGFQLMDINNKGKINIDELRAGLQKLGQQIPDADLQILMEAVSTVLYFKPVFNPLTSWPTVERSHTCRREFWHELWSFWSFAVYFLVDKKMTFN